MNDRKQFIAVCQKWEESERGWGTRPDGYSLHLSQQDKEHYIKTYWEGMPDSVPDEYSRPDGTAYQCSVSEEVFEAITKNGGSLREYGTPPGSGGVDGWIPLGGDVSGKK